MSFKELMEIQIGTTFITTTYLGLLETGARIFIIRPSHRES